MNFRLNNLVFSDPVLKVFSVLLGCALFLLVREDRIRELEISVPVVIGAVGDGRILTSGVPSSLRVRVRGRWSSMIRVLEGKPSPYEVEIASRQDGETYSFAQSTLKGLIGVQDISIVGIEPATFDVRIEELLSRVVPIDVQTVGQVPDDYLIDPGGISFEPRSVRVSGPRSSVEGIEKVQSYPIALDGLSRDLRAEIWLKRPQEKWVSLGTDQITVEVAVHEREGETQMESTRIHVENCAGAFHCTTVPETALLTARGGRTRLRWMEGQLDARWLMVNAGEMGQKPGAYDNVPVFARPVEGIVSIPEPRAVRLVVRRVEPEEQDAENADTEEPLKSEEDANAEKTHGKRKP